MIFTVGHSTRAQEELIAILKEAGVALLVDVRTQLIADALVSRGVEVVHLLAPGRRQPHVLHPAAVAGPEGILVYPGPKRAGPVDSGPARSTNG